MELLGELLVEFLTGLADFDERKYLPFSPRYWLGWLGVLVNLLLLGLLGFVTGFFFMAFLKGKDWPLMITACFFVPFVIFWAWKSLTMFGRMWQITRYYQSLS